MTEIATEVRGDATVLRPNGRLDIVTAPQLRSLIADSLAAGFRTIVVDLEDVTLLDSSGLGSLIGGMKSAREAGGDLLVARPAEQARLVHEITALDGVLTLHDSVERALADS